MWSLVVIVAVVAVGFFMTRGNGKVEYETESAQKKDVFQTVSITGELVSESEIDLNFEIGGRVKSINAYVGKKVARGDVIGMIKDDILGQEYNRAEAALNQALANAGASDDVIREAEQGKDNAGDYLEEVEDLEDQKVSAAEQAYEDAKDYYDDALSYYNKVVDDEGADSVATKSAKLTLDGAKSSKNSTREAVEIAEKAKDLAIVLAENSIKTAKESLKTAQSDFSKKSRDSSVQSARATYNIALANLEKAALKAPVSGMITEINYEAGEVIGSSTFSGDNFAKIITSDFIIETNTSESDIMKIKNGQSATVIFDAFEESETFSATVVEIDPASTVIQDVVYYKVKLSLQDFDIRLKAGMSVDVDIHTAEKRNVIAVPRRAVGETDSKKTVEVLVSENEVKTVEVKTGLSGDEGEIEIVSGLNESDEVVILRREVK